MRLSIVIPAYNEADGIGPLLERVLSVKRRLLSQQDSISDVEIIVVDDGSQDETRERLAAIPEVRTIAHPTNRGYGGALKTGFAEAAGELIAFLDADGTYPPEAIPGLCESLLVQDADMVVGSRMHRRQGMPRLRYLGNWFFASLVSRLGGTRVIDTASGLRVFRRTALQRLLPLPDGLNLTPAMTTRAIHERLKVAEVPIAYAERVGRSKLSLVRDGLRFLRTIMTITSLYNPLELLGTLAVLVFGVAFLLGVPPVLFYLEHRAVPDFYLYRLFAVLALTVTGIHLLTFGVLANHILELIHGRLYRASILARLLLTRGVVHRMSWLGVALVLLAPILNWRAIYTYLRFGHIDIHWVYVLSGAFLYLTGLQLIMAGVVATIFRTLEEHQRLFRVPPDPE